MKANKMILNTWKQLPLFFVITFFNHNIYAAEIQTNQSPSSDKAAQETCKSYGLKKGTKDYVDCMLRIREQDLLKEQSNNPKPLPPSKVIEGKKDNAEELLAFNSITNTPVYLDKSTIKLDGDFVTFKVVNKVKSISEYKEMNMLVKSACNENSIQHIENIFIKADGEVVSNKLTSPHINQYSPNSYMDLMTQFACGKKTLSEVQSIKQTLPEPVVVKPVSPEIDPAVKQCLMKAKMLYESTSDLVRTQIRNNDDRHLYFLMENMKYEASDKCRQNTGYADLMEKQIFSYTPQQEKQTQIIRAPQNCTSRVWADQVITNCN